MMDRDMAICALIMAWYRCDCADDLTDQQQKKSQRLMIDCLYAVGITDEDIRRSVAEGHRRLVRNRSERVRRAPHAPPFKRRSPDIN